MSSPATRVSLALLSLSALLLNACALRSPGLSYAPTARTQLAGYPLLGDTLPVHDPSVMRLGGTYYSFTTDIVGTRAVPSLPIRCSQDQTTWATCASVFPAGMPAWVKAAVPGIVGLWAPDVAYFNGLYHVYYSGSTLGSQRSVIGVAVNKTLDPADTTYRWVDQGPVLESVPGDDFNAIDPNILVDSDGRVWMSYGSYWTGIKQVELDASTGKVLAGAQRYDLATRPGVEDNPIEGASVVRHGNYYYLFVSVDYCCNRDVTTDNYKQAMGRGPTPHGPFVDQAGTPMLEGGGTVLLAGNGTWNAPGGGTAYIDAETGNAMLIFHALNMQQNGAMSLWVKQIAWQDDWPVLVPTSSLGGGPLTR